MNLTQARGVAALAVSASHALFVFTPELAAYPPLQQWDAGRVLLAFVANGHTAVMFFFVLSGYVLGLSMARRPRGYCAFLWRRFLRLWPAHAVSLSCISIAVYLAPAVHDIASPFSSIATWFEPVTWRDYFANLFMLASPINHVTWTLPWEALAAIWLFPVAYVFRRTGPWWSAGIVLTLLGLDIAKDGVFDIFSFAYVFASGLWLATHASKARLPLWCAPVAIAVAGGMELLPHDITRNTTMHLMRFSQVAAGVVVLLALAHQKPLAWPLLTRLGERAYSFYLLHLAILYACAIVWIWLGFAGGLLGNLCLLAISVVSTWPLACLLYTLVERRFVSKRQREA